MENNSVQIFKYTKVGLEDGGTPKRVDKFK